ncbi:protein mini spindles isoform X2 [Zootermopsis nevadensis]|uniref:protein mini spindles isoform X2 n=1 Tax=Zootermopsis nevadensis TaxID=136037 RepID=UPI000B8E893D|nr:protein mini spindles isoform X2 [Zootermopsis nevadensis]
MEEDTEYIKLPVEDRCVHKLWKARLNGYEEAAKLFQQIDDEKSPEFNKFLGLVKKFVVDSNAVAQEKGLEAVLAFVENSASSAKTVGEVMSGIISKCIAAPKAKTRELAVQIALMYIEIEKFEAVQEELLKGMEHKNPKIVSACVSAVTQALRNFGPKVVNIKPLIKKMPVLLEDRDKFVREEGKTMVIEIYRWIGDALKPQLNSLKPVQVTVLESEFEKVRGEKALPIRYLKSQQQKQAKMAAEAAAAAGDGEDELEDEKDGAPDVDPNELFEPVDILSKLSKEFYEKLEAKKWQERKEAVDYLEQLLQTPKLESGDYGDVVRALKKIISKDTNVMVVAVAGKCVAGLANGLKKRFQPYALFCIPCILEKFREKKQNVVVALREAVDAVFMSTTIEAIQEDVLIALENKNPQVKAETASFLARCFTKCTPAMLNKKLLKAYTTALLKTLNESDPTVRDSSAEALGAAMKVVGEKPIMIFMTDLDNIKMTKIKECCDKAVIVSKVPKTDRPNTAPAKLARGNGEGGGKVVAGSVAPKPVKRPATVGGAVPPKKTQQKKQLGCAPAGKGKAPAKVAERNLGQEEVDEKASAIFSEEIISGLSDGNWKTRLSAVEQLTQWVVEIETEIPTQVIIRTLNKKPGLKDTNVQVLKARLEAVKLLAENARFTSTVLDYCITDIADKLGDVKNGTLAAETLTSLAEATKLELVATEVMNFAFTQKSPKVQQEALAWLSTAIREFGFQSVQPKPIMDNVKKAVSASNPAVRSVAINLIGTLYLYLGSQLSVFFEDEKSQLQQQIKAEFAKHAGEAPPVPIRGLSKKIDREEEEEEDDDDDGEDVEGPVNEKLNIHDLMPHVDISSHITDSLLSELQDRNWKVRNEALQKVANILSENKLVSNNLGELPTVLSQRLVDSNSKIAAAAITICQSLVNAMGVQCKRHVRTLFPGMLQGMGDSKPWIRSSATACVNAWGQQCGFKEFFDGEMIGDALKSGSPTLRIELWAWLTEILPTLPPRSISKDELLICLPHLYANVEDRSADVRKNAQEAIVPFMIHLGYTTMAKASEKLKTGSRSVVIAALDKARPNLPEKSLPPKKTGASVTVDDDAEPSKVVRSGVVKGASGKNAKGKVIGASKSSGRKKDEDIDTSPLLQSNNLKHQRLIDEQKLKVLKWNFTTPREEFVDLLKDQMTVANVNKTLLTYMFHSDFKFHLKAIDSLSEDLPNNESATVANLDLILKWLTLRFFDTNPSVLLKGLEYLQTVFTMLITEGYNMFDNEASSFIPYLILKIGDPKDAVRNGVRALFRQMEQVYPATKLFVYVMEGLKSKNARQRTECLEQLGSLIENYGVTVCHPSPSAALKEIARQISDRDNSVRNAALNCVVQAYFIEQDKVYKMIGQISDKDLSLLEERIKRAAKNKVTRAPNVSKQQQQQLQQPQPQKMVRQGSEGTIKKETIEREESPPPPPPTMRSTVPKPRPISTGPFGLDINLLERIEGHGVNLNAPKLAEFDLHDIIDDTPVSIPNVNTGTVSYGLMGLDPLHLYYNPLDPFYSSYPTLSPPPVLQPYQLKLLHNLDEKTDMLLDSCIPNIACPDIRLAIQTAIQLDTLLQTDKAMKLDRKVDQVILGCVMQLRLLTSDHRVGTPRGDVTRAFRVLFMLLMSFYSNSTLSRQVSKDVLCDLIEQLISLLVNKHMEQLESGESYVRIINTLVVRIIERSDHTNITCALIKLLYESAGNSTSSPRFMDLVMKCLWKVVKMFPLWEAETDFDIVLCDIHMFLKDFPSASWKKRPSDTPVRTIKTILHRMTKIKGNRILLHLSRIENLNESELQSYLVKLIKTVKHDSSPPKKESKSQHRLSKTTHELLSDIFKKIGSKDQTKEGLSLLYDFKQQHPEADIEPFLRKSSQFFQEYIQKGLHMIDMDRRKAGKQVVHPATAPLTSTSRIMDSNPVTPQNEVGEPSLQNPNSVYVDQHRSVKTRVGIDSGEDSDSSSGSKNALYYLKRLRALQEQAGHDPSAVLLESKQQVSQDKDDNVVNDENLNKKSVLYDMPERVQPVQCITSNSGFSEVDALRRRLEVVKGSAR